MRIEIIFHYSKLFINFICGLAIAQNPVSLPASHTQLFCCILKT